MGEARGSKPGHRGDLITPLQTIQPTKPHNFVILGQGKESSCVDVNPKRKTGVYWRMDDSIRRWASEDAKRRMMRQVDRGSEWWLK